MDFWQIWYMRRTENPVNVVRVHEDPQNIVPKCYWRCTQIGEEDGLENR